MKSIISSLSNLYTFNKCRFVCSNEKTNFQKYRLSVRPLLVPCYLDPNERQQRINNRFSPLCVYVEHTFHDLKKMFHYFINSTRMKLLLNGEMIKMTIVVIFFNLSCYYCLNNTSSRNVDLPAPSLEGYLSLDKISPPREDDDDNAVEMVRQK